MIGLELFAKAAGFDGRETVVRIVEEMQVRAEFLAQALEKARDKIEVELGAPSIFLRRILYGRLIVHFAAPDAIDAVEAGDAALRANGFVAHLGILGNGGDGVIDIFAAGVTVDEDSIA